MQNSSSLPGLREYLPNDDVLSQCIHCGLCLAVCPTYEITKMERSSPRGRIKMIKNFAEGGGQVSEIFSEEMNFCLDCQACETACPAGVKYGKLVESARVVISEEPGNKKFKERFKKYLLNKIIADPKRLKFYSRIIRLYQKSYFRYILEENAVLKMFPGNIPGILKLVPGISEKFSSDEIDEITVPGNDGIRYKVAFHTGCIMDTAFADINNDTIDVLKAYGCSVFTPKEQSCCGSLQAHNGEIKKARELAKKNIDLFEKGKYEFLISNSAGCGAFMKEYGELLQDDIDYSIKAKKFSEKVKDVTEFLSGKKPVKEFKRLEMRATYHDACHLVHSQKVYNEPRELLKSIPGFELIELNESTKCCGSAGIYNVVRYDDSMIFLKSKLLNIKESNTGIVISGNPGCISQIKAGAEKFNTFITVLHPVSVLKRAIYGDNI